MLTETRRREIHDALSQEIEGGVSKGFDQIIDEWLDEERMTEEEWGLNEVEIAHIFDDGFFECQGCGWTVPVDATGVKDFYCSDHDDEFEDDD